MNKYLIIACVILAAMCAVLYGINDGLRSEKKRLTGNQQALMDEVEFYQSEAGKSAASVQRLELSYKELSDNYDLVCKTADDLRVKLKRIQATSTTETKTEIQIQTIVKDSIVFRDGALDSIKAIRWSDPWVTVQGEIDNRNLSLNVSSADTLVQIVHRVPKRFLFFRWGTKAIRQEITSKNPHTQIVYSEYIELKK